MKKTLSLTMLLLVLLTLGLFVSCKEEPEPPSVVSVTGVTLDKTELSLQVGGSGNLTATITPENATDNTVSWSSSNENVATVDDSGKVTAVVAGTAIITVTTTDGSKTDTCTVTVTAATFKAVYNTNSSPTTLTFYYDEVDHSGEGTVYKGTDLLNTETINNPKNWGYNTNRSSIESIVINDSVANYKGLTSTKYMFYGMINASEISGAEYLDVSNVTDMKGMFYKCKKLSKLDVSGFDTSKVTSMNNMFEGCGSLETIGLDGFTVGNGTTVEGMFSGCSKLASVKISPKNEKIAGALGDNWNYNEANGAYELATPQK